MRGQVVGTLSGLGRERGTLGEIGRTITGRGEHGLHTRAIDATGIRAGQPDAAPKIGPTLGREVTDRGLDPIRVRSAHKPQTASEPLVERATRVADKRPRTDLIVDRTRGMKVALMKSVPVDHEPAQQRIAPLEPAFDASADSRKGPADADMHHVRVRASGPGQKRLHA